MKRFDAFYVLLQVVLSPIIHLLGSLDAQLRIHVAVFWSYHPATHRI